jgi:hypothetical protein
VINPAGIPTIPGDMGALDGHATALRETGTDFAATGARIDSTWQGLNGVYDAPEVGQLLAATAPVKTISASVGSDLGTVAAALATYAAEVRQIQAQLAALKSQATEFVAAVHGQDDWTSDGSKVDRNNELIKAVDTQMAAFFDAQRRCANAINALYGGPQYRADNGDGKLTDGEYGYRADQLNAAAGQDKALPWGTTEQKDRGFWGDVGAFFGGIKDGAVGFVTGLGALIGRDPTTGQWSWSMAGTAWKGLGTFALAAGVYAMPGGAQLDQTIGVPGMKRGQLGDTLLTAGKSLIAYDEWGKDPARAAGTATFNVVSAVIGTKGAGAALRGAGAAAEGSRIAAVSTAGTAMVRTGEFIGNIPKVSDLAKGLAQRIPGLRLPSFSAAGDIKIAEHVDAPAIHPPDTPTVHAPHADVPTTPRPGTVGDGLTHTPHVPEAPAPTPPATVHHVDTPTPHHTDSPAPQRSGPQAPPHADTPAPRHAAPHTDAPNPTHHVDTPHDPSPGGHATAHEHAPQDHNHTASDHAAHDHASVDHQPGHPEVTPHHDLAGSPPAHADSGLGPVADHPPATPQPLHREDPLPTGDLLERYKGESDLGVNRSVHHQDMTLLYLSSGRGRHNGGGEGAVEFAGDVALEAASDLAGGLALGGAASDVGAGPGTATHSDHGDGVDRAVECAIAAAVEPVAYGSAAAGLQRAGAGQGGERGIVSAASGMGETHDRLGGGDRPEAPAVGQSRGEIVHDGLQLCPIGLERSTGVAHGQGETTDLSVAHGLLTAGVAGHSASGQAGENGLGECAAGEVAIVVVAVAQQSTEPIDLRGGGHGELVAGTEQDPQCFSVPVDPGNGESIGVETKRSQHGQVRVDRVGLAPPAPSRAAGLLALDDPQTGSHRCAGQSTTVAAGALDRHDQPRARGVIGDPGKQLGIPRGVVADRTPGDRRSARERDLYLMRIAVGVDTDHGVDEFCQHGHRPSPSREWVNGRHRPG